MMYIPFEPVDSDVVVVNPSHWVFANTGLNSGAHLAGLLGYEVDAISGHAPANLVDLAHSPYVFSDGSNQVADMTVYQATSGAYVFATGTVQWSWGLSNISPWGPSVSRVSAAAQKITRNVLDTFINNPPAAPATISLRGIGSASTSGTGGDHITVNVPSGVTPGDVMIAQVAVRGGSGTTLTAPAGWSLVRRDNNGSNLLQAAYSHVVPTSPAEPASYTWNFSAGNDGTAAIADFVGVSTVSPVEVHNGQSNASSTSITAPSVTIASGHNADLLLEMFATATGSAVSVPPGSTYVWGFPADSSGAGMGMAYLNPVPSGASGNWVATSSSAAANIGALIALAPGSPVPTATVSATPAGTSSAGATPTSSATPTTVPTPTPTQVATPTPTPTSGGTMATIVLRGVTTGSTASGSLGSVTINVPASIQANDVMLAEIAVRGGSGTTLTPPAQWALVRRDNNSSTISQALYVHVVTAPASEPASYTWTFTSGTDGAGGMVAYGGVSSAMPVDVAGGQANASSTSITAASVTVPSGNNADRLVGLFAIPNSSAVTGPSGMTQRWSLHASSGGIGVEMSDLALSSSGATGSMSATAGTAGANIGALVALLPASTGATPTVSATPSGTPTPAASPTPAGTPAPTATATAATPTSTPTSAGPTPTPAPITLRGVTTGSTASGSLGSVTINVPASIQANDVMLAEIAVRGGSGTTLTPPAQWALVRRDNNSSTISQALYVHVVTAPASEPASYTWTFTSGTDGAGGMVAYGGVSSAMPVDVAGGQANASSTSITAASVTVPSGNNADRLVGLFAIPNSSAVTGPSGMTQRWSLHASSGGIGVEMSDLALSSSGATGSMSATAGTAGANIGALVALLPASTGATPTVSATPSGTPTPTVSATPSGTPTLTASPTPSGTPTPAASPTPAGTPAPTATATAATPTSTPTSAGPTPTPAPITLRGVTTGSTASGSLGSVTINVPASIQANDVMLAEIAVRGGSGTTLTPPAQWALVRRDNNSSTISQALYVHMVTAPASEPASYTWTFTSGTDGAGGMVAYGGVSSAMPVDVAGGQANASSTSITAASVTVPSGNNADRLVGLFAIPNSSAVTGPSGMTQRWSLHASSGGIGVEMSDLALSSSGATGSMSATAGTAGANIGALVALLPASISPTPSPTPSNTPTPTASATPTPSDTPTPTASATPTPTASATPTPTASATPTPSDTPTPTASATPTPSDTPTPTASATPTPSDTPTPTASATPTPSDTPTPTASATPTPSDTPTPTASATPTPSDTPTPTASATPTPSDTPTPTASATPTPSDTPTPTASATPTPSDTPTPTASATPTPSDTPTPTASATPTPSDTPTPTASATPTPSDTPTPTASATPTPSDTPTPTASATPTPSDTPTPTASATPTPSDTPTPTASATPTPSDAPTPTDTPTATESVAPTDTATPSPTPTSTPAP